MSTNAYRDRFITLREVSEHCPARRRGKRPHLATVYRWAFYGVHGVYLDFVGGGRRTLTTEAALFLFLNRLAAVQRRLAGPKSTGKNDWVIDKEALHQWNQWLQREVDQAAQQRPPAAVRRRRREF